MGRALIKRHPTVRVETHSQSLGRECWCESGARVAGEKCARWTSYRRLRRGTAGSALQVPVIQGTDLLSSAEEALKAAEIIGFPVSALRRFDLLLLHLKELIVLFLGRCGISLRLCSKPQQAEEEWVCRSVRTRPKSIQLSDP
jgi:hypothetical protein